MLESREGKYTTIWDFELTSYLLLRCGTRNSKICKRNQESKRLFHVIIVVKTYLSTKSLDNLSLADLGSIQSVI